MTKQPIETAPKDGTWIIVSGGHTDETFSCFDPPPVEAYRPVVARWDDNYDTEIKLPDGEYDYEKGAWVFSFWDGSWYSKYVHPTHWQPLTEG